MRVYFIPAAWVASFCLWLRAIHCGRWIILGKRLVCALCFAVRARLAFAGTGHSSVALEGAFRGLKGVYNTSTGDTFQVRFRSCPIASIALSCANYELCNFFLQELA